MTAFPVTSEHPSSKPGRSFNHHSDLSQTHRHNNEHGLRRDTCGHAGPDVIQGPGGDDMFGGLQGDDVICGGTGDVTFYDGIGNDRFYGKLVLIGP